MDWRKLVSKPTESPTTTALVLSLIWDVNNKTLIIKPIIKLYNAIPLPQNKEKNITPNNKDKNVPKLNTL